MPRERALLLHDAVVACDRVTEYVRDLDAGAFVRDLRTYDAVVRNLEVVGEALRQLRQFYPDTAEGVLNLPRIVAMRHVLAHSYFSLDDEIIWQAASEEIPRLRDQLASLGGTPPADTP